MKKHELEAAIAAAQAELERLQAMQSEPELHPMTLPLERVQWGGKYWKTAGDDKTLERPEFRDALDDIMWKTANYYASKEQATAYADAFEVLRLIRRQPGIVDPTGDSSVYRPTVTDDRKVAVFLSQHVFPGFCMFPCFRSEQAAQAAIDAVGAERMIKAAKWLAGVGE